ncbi:MAG: tRNA pseudouridine(38-40) synthase TruA [Methanomassiliicoccaceae archaeon]|jgi:tRNA pseudouridine38-40 synthase|nr:tRNA pseudouridine(38-40) synthase TruA [Methanomassiliicoccaceae archaeon]
MKRVAVKIAYLGEEFAGSQIQPGLRTVEGDVLADLKKISELDDDTINLKCASRTDRGVNALGNTIVFNTTFGDNAELLKALNAISKGVFYRSIADVSDGFNPRHANERVYMYILPSAGMNADLVKQCASLFEGEHDLMRFCKTDERPTVTNMRSIKVNDVGGAFVLEFRSEFFLWNQIRRTVAAISAVGYGNWGLDDVKRALKGDDITFGIARPDALALMDVIYNDVEFTPTDTYAQRANEERFKVMIKQAFFYSL